MKSALPIIDFNFLYEKNLNFLDLVSVENIDELLALVKEAIDLILKKKKSRVFRSVMEDPLHVRGK
jgi:hypothetical protein